MANYLRSIRAAKLRCEAFENPALPLLDDDGVPVLKDGQPDCTHYVRVLALDDAMQLNKALEQEGASEADKYWAVLSRTWCDENGVTFLSAEDRPVVDGLSLEALKPILEAAKRVNGLGDTAKNS